MAAVEVLVDPALPFGGLILGLINPVPVGVLPVLYSVVWRSISRQKRSGSWSRCVVSAAMSWAVRGPHAMPHLRSARVRTVALRGMTDSVVVRVKPGSRKGPLVEVGPNGELTIYVREPAVDGKANDAVTRVLAAHLQLPRSRVELVSGAASRLKRFRVSR